MISTVAMVIMKFYPRCKNLASADISQWPDHHDSGTNPTYQYYYGVILSELKRERKEGRRRRERRKRTGERGGKEGERRGGR